MSAFLLTLAGKLFWTYGVPLIISGLRKFGFQQKLEANILSGVNLIHEATADIQTYHANSDFPSAENKNNPSEFSGGI